MESYIVITLYAISVIVLAYLLFVIVRQPKKNLLKMLCALTIAIVFLWTVFELTNYILFLVYGHYFFIFFFLASIEVYFLPSVLALFAMAIIRRTLNSRALFLLFLIPPAISVLMLATYGINDLYLVRYIDTKNSAVWGPYNLIHCSWQLLFAFFAIYYIIRNSLKYTNCLTNQNLLVLSAILAPVLVDVILFVNLLSSVPVVFDKVINAASFCVSAICLTQAITHYRFLDAVPIALKNVIDRISDSFFIIDQSYTVLDLNDVLKTEFQPYLTVTEENFFQLFGSHIFHDFKASIKKAHKDIDGGSTHCQFEFSYTHRDDEKYFDVEITPFYWGNQSIAMLVLLKNKTAHIENIKLIEEKNKQLIEKARLISLNQLVGGIAHNVKSPLMSSSGGMLFLEKSTTKIIELFTKQELFRDNPGYIEILSDMQKWEGMIKQYLMYISDIISALNEQTSSYSDKAEAVFTVKELINKVTLLMEYEFRKANCSMNRFIELDYDTTIEGDITALTQILNNIIINALHASSNGARIDLTIQDLADGVSFAVKDYGTGMDEDIQKKIFHQMITTKGTGGTGLGLYIANIAVKSQFGGTIRFESEKNKGTTVTVTIPKNKTI